MCAGKVVTVLIRGRCCAVQGSSLSGKGWSLCCSGVVAVLVRDGHCAGKGSSLCW